MIRAAVYGASGYGGAELLRLLLQHPDVEVAQATSRERGQRLDALHPGLRGLTDLETTTSAPGALDPDLDAIFFALPHGCSAEVMEAVLERCATARVYDLAQDHRTGHETDGWVYGLPELFAREIAGARTVACPGCFATAILFGTAPAIAAGWAPERIIVDAKTGSSGSGNAPGPGTHHPARVSTFKAYKVFQHQHETEITAAWTRLDGHSPLPALHFVPQSSPLVRGIYACCYLVGGRTVGRPDGRELYGAFYASAPFVRLTDEPPNVLDVRGTNNVDLHVAQQDDVTLVIVAIDNLVRGAAGQAVQCMNLGFGLPVDRGLRLPALVV